MLKVLDFVAPNICFLTLFSEEQTISQAEIEEVGKMPAKEACNALLSQYGSSFPMDAYEQLKQIF